MDKIILEGAKVTLQGTEYDLDDPKQAKALFLLVDAEEEKAKREFYELGKYRVRLIRLRRFLSHITEISEEEDHA